MRITHFPTPWDELRSSQRVRFYTVLSSGHIASLNKLEGAGINTYNLGTGNGTTVLELICAFERVNGIKLNYEFTDRRDGDLEVVYANSEKALREIGWEAHYTVDDMCRHGYNFIKKL